MKIDQWGDLECMYIKPAKQLELMEAYSQTLAKMNKVKMNDKAKMTMRWKPFARSRDQKTDKSWCKQD